MSFALWSSCHPGPQHLRRRRHHRRRRRRRRRRRYSQKRPFNAFNEGQFSIHHHRQPFSDNAELTTPPTPTMPMPMPTLSHRSPSCPEQKQKISFKESWDST